MPFEVKSGPFDRWEVISSTSYTYDPNVDTLVLNLQSDVIVQAYFIPPIPTRDITYDINLIGTSTSVTANGALITNFPTTITYNLGDTVNVSPTIDPLFGFDSVQINYKLCISYNGIREESFLFNIYNRNSEVVFSTNSIAELNCNNGWEGRHQETNKKLTQGIYVYTIYYQDFEGWKHQNTSTINLIR